MAKITQYLVDTHIFLLWLNGDKMLKTSTQKVLTNSNNTIYVSIVTLWEITIKHANGKLPLKTTLPEMISLSGFQVLPITVVALLELEKLPHHHNDPFDRLLISQAITENLTLISNDTQIKQYDIKTL